MQRTTGYRPSSSKPVLDLSGADGFDSILEVLDDDLSVTLVSITGAGERVADTPTLVLLGELAAPLTCG